MLKHDDLRVLAANLGIAKAGVAPAEPLSMARLDTWLERGYQGRMSYMERNQENRLSPVSLLPGACSVISIFVNYHQSVQRPDLDGVISKYARGKDYHLVLKDLLHTLAEGLFGDLQPGLSRREKARLYRVCVDSAPVMEKVWAVRAGLGWQGKHSNLITRDQGSWGFLGELITTEPFDIYDQPIPDHCGTCTACIDACPTAAIVEPYVVDGSRCISYATIELDAAESIPEPIRENLDNWIFGCDVCQDVCPWNRFAQQSDVTAFVPLEAFRDGVPRFETMSESEFVEIFRETALARPGLNGLRRNQKIRG